MVKVCDQNGFGSIGRMLLGLHMMVISKMMMIAVFMVMNVNFRETVEDTVNNFHGGKTNNGKRVQG